MSNTKQKFLVEIETSEEPWKEDQLKEALSFSINDDSVITSLKEISENEPN